MSQTFIYNNNSELIHTPTLGTFIRKYFWKKIGLVKARRNIHILIIDIRKLQNFGNFEKIPKNILNLGLSKHTN